MRKVIEQLVNDAVARLRGQGLPLAAVAFTVGHPREKHHGDYATNAAMVLSKGSGIKPRELAERLVATLTADPEAAGVVARCEVAGPGFVNFHLSPTWLRQLVGEILRVGEGYGLSRVGQGQRMLVEFVSANPTGPMHVGHGRGAVTGDVIARLLEATGFTVEREYYINDMGGQIKALARSVWWRYRELLGAIPTGEEFPEDGYPGEYVIDLARRLRERDGERWLVDPAGEMAAALPLEVTGALAVTEVMGWIREDLDRLGVRFDHWFSERSLHESGGIDHALSRLQEGGWLYEGILTPPRGKVVEDWEPRPQILFRSTRCGDEVDRPLRKSDGSYTYFAADIAYHLHKAERGFDGLVNVWGADHGGYVKRVEAALEVLTGRQGLLEVRLMQLVNLTRGGVPVRMSKRAGNFVTLRELIDEVGADAIRFWFLTRAEGSPLDFDLELAVARSNDNPVYYVQYAHARICSVFRQLGAEWSFSGGEVSGEVALARLTTEAELDLIRLLGRYPEVVEGAALQREPHRLTYYLLETASSFHAYYNQHRILEEDVEVRHGRLALIAAVGRVIANGLSLLGVTAPERL